MMKAFKVSYKPQRILANSGLVSSLLKKRMVNIHDSQFVSDVIKPLEIEDLMDRNVEELSGGELQRVALCICLGKVSPFLCILLYLCETRGMFAKSILIRKIPWPNKSYKSFVCLFLFQTADIYLIDEPSAYLDSEQRINASKVIRRFILHNKKTAFVVEHDFIMATYLADRVIVYEGTPSIDCVANAPQSLLTGMNLFLSVSVCFISI